MKKTLILFWVTLLIACTVVGCSEETEQAWTYSDPAESITSKVGKEFYISLGCKNHSGNYNWYAIYNQTLLELVDSGLDMKEDVVSENNGTKWFRFNALKSGNTEITMLYEQWSEINRKQLDKKVFLVIIE